MTLRRGPLIAALIALIAPAPSRADGPSFEAVRPILEEHCFGCHGGGEKLRGNLDLTRRAGALRGGDFGPAVDLEFPEASVLLEAIRYESLEMPPSGQLDQATIDALTAWVMAGASYGDEDNPEAPAAEVEEDEPYVSEADRDFWSFRPVERPAVPAVERPDWVRNPIDAFVLHRLESEGLAPAPEASRATLIRRLSFDLLGLPPTPEEVDAFLGDDRPDAYERLVDRLLASPHYGERWARHWLDVVRFAETNSFERDSDKPASWRYRDYVVDAFNRDLPYDRFVREQLAGDELDEPTASSIVATGYYRLGAWDDEPTDRLQARYDELDDIITTTGQGFLGLTVNCARCHDHKIDPIPQADYYRFLAFFHNLKPYSYDESHILTDIAGDAERAAHDRHRRRAASGRGVDRGRADAAGGADPRDGPRAAAGAARRGRLRGPSARPRRHGGGRARRRGPRPLPGPRRPLAGDPAGPAPADGPQHPRVRPRGPRDVRPDPRRRRQPRRPGRAGLPGGPRRRGRRGAAPAARGRVERPSPGPGRLDRQPREPADRPGDRQPGLALPLRPRDRPDPQRLRLPGHARRPIPSCSTGWPPSSSPTAGGSRRCTG